MAELLPDVMPRVAYVLADFPVASEQFIAREVQALRELGVILEIKTIRRDADGIPAKSLVQSLHAVVRSPRSSLLTLREAWRLRHSERHRAGFAKRYLDAARIAHELAGFGPDLIHAHFVNAPAMTARLVAHWLGKPWGASAHARDLFVDVEGLTARLGNVNHIIVCSEFAANYVRSILPPEMAVRVHRVYHGVRLSPVPTGVRDKGLIVAAGRFVRKKGFGVLVAALDILHRRGVSFRAEIIGAGPEESELRTRIERLGISEKAGLTSWKQPSELEATLRRASVVVVPSVIDSDGDRDNIPNVLVEALALQIPVVASSLPSIAELNENGAILLVAANDADEIANALERVLLSPELSESVGKKGRSVAERHFDSRANGRRLLEIFRTSAHLKEAP